MALNRVKDILSNFKISKSQFYDQIYPQMPPTLYIGSSPRWSDEAISEWIAANSKVSPDLSTPKPSKSQHTIGQTFVTPADQQDDQLVVLYSNCEGQTHAAPAERLPLSDDLSSYYPDLKRHDAPATFVAAEGVSNAP